MLNCPHAAVPQSNALEVNHIPARLGPDSATKQRCKGQTHFSPSGCSVCVDLRKGMCSHVYMRIKFSLAQHHQGQDCSTARQPPALPARAGFPSLAQLQSTEISKFSHPLSIAVEMKRSCKVGSGTYLAALLFIVIPLSVTPEFALKNTVAYTVVTYAFFRSPPDTQILA